jgi:hypothetical protein
MTLQPGYRLAVAPKFHLDANWSTRVSVGVGLEEVGGQFFPRGPWRASTQDELAVLISTTEQHVHKADSLQVSGQEQVPASGSTTDGVCLFQIPEHMRSAWWSLLDAVADSGAPMQGFDEFAAKVSEFLAFKRLTVPGSLQMEVIVTAAGARTIRRDPETGQGSGLGSTIAPWAAWPLHESDAVPRLCALVNLGDEPSNVVLVNLPLAGLAAELATRTPNEVCPATVGEVVEWFCRDCSDYPPVSVKLGPAEGCWLPVGGLVLDGDPSGKEEPDMLLLISTNITTNS